MVTEPSKKSKRAWGVEEEGIEGLMEKLYCDLNPIIDYFQGKEFRMDRSVSVIVSSGHHGLRSSLIGVMQKRSTLYRKKEL